MAREAGIYKDGVSLAFHTCFFSFFLFFLFFIPRFVLWDTISPD